METAENINLPVVNVKGPESLVTAEWEQRREQVIKSAAAIEAINTDAEFDQAGQLINVCAHLCKELEADRKKLTAPLDVIKKNIMAVEKNMTSALTTEQTRLRALANVYATRKAVEREAAERAAREAAAEAAAKAAEQAELQAKAREAFGAFGDAGDSVPVPQTPTVIVPEQPKSSSVKQVTVITFEITDASKLDRKFLSPDESKIRAFCQYVKNMAIDPETINEPGLKIKKEIRIDSK